jgi:hypothetical protein
MFARDRLLTAGIVALTTLAQACSACLKREQLNTLQQQVELQNLSESEPSMRAAARSAGATLLRLLPQELYEPELIPTEDESVYRLFDAPRGERLVIAIPSRAWRYTRLAQSGDTFFILEPKPTQRQTDQVDACACGAGPYNVIGVWHVFFVEPRASVTVQRITVPMIERVLDVRCRGYAR